MRATIAALLLLAAVANAVPHHKSPSRPAVGHALAPPRELGGDKCAACEVIVGVVETALKQNSTEEALQKALKATCTFASGILPAIKDECDTLVQYLPVIVDGLISNLTPADICAKLGFCSSQAPVAVPITAPRDECSTCKTLVTVVEMELKQNSTEDAIEKALESACDAVGKLFPAAKAECDALVAELPQVIDYLTQNYTPEQVCEMIGACKSSTPAKTPSVPAGVNIHAGLDECSVCQTIVQLAETEIKANKTEQEIQKLVGEACDFVERYVPKAKVVCDVVIGELPQIIEYVLDDLTPEEICKKIGACKSQTSTHVTKAAAVAQHVVEVRQNVNIDECSTCKTLVGIVETELQTNATEKELEKVLDSACTLIGKYLPSVQAECQAVVQNLPTIINYLTSSYTPDEVCQLIGACSGKTAVETAVVVKAPLDECSTCKTIVTIVESELAANSTEQQIENLLDKACTLVGKYLPSVQPECEAIIQNLPSIIDALESKYPADQVCQMVGLCKSRTVLPTAMLPKTDQCEFCQELLFLASDAASAEGSQTHMDKALKTVCASTRKLVPSAAGACDKLEADMPRVVFALTHNTPARETCEHISLC